MRILVLGGTRFIGLHAVRRLVALGHDVHVFHRGNSMDNLPDPLTHIIGDRANIADIIPQFDKLKPDVVINMIGLDEQDGESQFQMFQNKIGRYVVISSADVYRAYDRLRLADPGAPDPTPLTEQSPLRDKLYPYRADCKGPEDRLYNYDKILLERALMADADAMPVTSIRLPMVYGPLDYQRRTHPYLKRMMDGRKQIILSKEQAQWHGLRGYVEDMAEAIALCALDTRKGHHIYNAADRVCLTEREWVEAIADANSWNGEILELPETSLPDSLKDPMDWNQDWALDSTLIRQELGYSELVPQKESMVRTVQWQSANMPAEFDTKQFDYNAEDEVLARAGG